MDRPDIDPNRFATHTATLSTGVEVAYVHEGRGGVPLVLVHGWPETRRIWWRVVEPLAAAGFEVIAPDLRGFGGSSVGDAGDAPACAADVVALCTEVLGHDRVVLAGGDFGGPIVQDIAIRHPDLVDRLVLFNSPLPFDRERMGGMATRAPRDAADYFRRQGTDADALAGEFTTPEQRRRYVATFYTSRFWAHPGSFDDAAVAFHTEPFGAADKLRAGFRAYEAAFDASARSAEPVLRRNPDVQALLLFGPSDQVLYPDFDRMAATVFPDHVGPFLLRDCGHFVPWEAPHAFSSAVIAFCGDLLARGR